MEGAKVQWEPFGFVVYMEALHQFCPTKIVVYCPLVVKLHWPVLLRLNLNSGEDSFVKEQIAKLSHLLRESTVLDIIPHQVILPKTILNV